MSSPAGPVLRPLGVGERIDAGFKILGRNFLSMAKAVLVVAVVAGVAEVLITLSITPPSATTTTGPFGTTQTHVAAGDVGAYAAGVFLVLVVGEIASAIATATCYRIIGGAYLGHAVAWRQALREGTRRFLSIIWILVLVGTVIVAPAIVLVPLAVALASSGVKALAILVIVFGALAWLVFVVWFSTCTRLAIPTLMIEDIRGWSAVRRSIRLCRGQWWSVFGTELLVTLITGVVGLVVGAVSVAAVAAAGHSTTASAVADFFTRTISLVVITPFTAAVLVVLAIDLRVRKEGFDIELLASRIGAPPTGSALSFMRGPAAPPFPYGYPTAGGGYPPPSPGYLPPSPSYPPSPSPSYPPQRPSYPPPAPSYPSPSPSYPPPAPAYLPPAAPPPGPSPAEPGPRDWTPLAPPPPLPQTQTPPEPAAGEDPGGDGPAPAG